jgi:hypothetical protein
VVSRKDKGYSARALVIIIFELSRNNTIGSAQLLSIFTWFLKAADIFSNEQQLAAWTEAIEEYARITKQRQ